MPAGTSPIWASVQTPGSLNGPATIHLLNPTGSGKRLWVRKLRVHITSPNTIKVRRTTSPIDLGGAGATTVDAAPIRMDERDATAVAAEFRGTTFTASGATFTLAESQWVGAQDNQSTGMLVLAPGDFSWSIEEDSAIEIASNANGAGITLRVHAVWDEIDV